MAAPIYSQAEADRMIAMAKVAPLADLQREKKSDTEGTSTRRMRVTKHEKRTIRQVEPEQESTVRFHVEICENTRTEGIAITLFGSMDSRPVRPLCRYEIQDSGHHNPPGFSPEFVGSGRPHRHMYSEHHEREYDSWSRCAEPIDIQMPATFSGQRTHLIGKFYADMNIKFSDGDEAFALFKGGM